MKQILSLWLFFCLMLFSDYINATVNINELTVQDNNGYSLLILDLDGPVKINAFPLDKPNRIVIDIFEIAINNLNRLKSLKSEIIKEVRASFQADGRLRIVLEVKRPIWPRSYFINENKNMHLIIELRDAAGVPIPIMNKIIETPILVNINKPADKDEKLTSSLKKLNQPVANKFLAAENKKNLEANNIINNQSSNSSKLDSNKLAFTYKTLESKFATNNGREILIAIDAGHGGKDPGAIGPGGTEEKNITLAIARRLAELIRRERGMTPLMIRNGDYYIGLRERLQKARDIKADLFISIHADSVRDPSVSGASIYVLSEKGASSEAARFLAEKENAVDLVGGVHLEKTDNNLARTLLDMSQNGAISTSIAIANQLLSYLEKTVAINRNSIERANFLVLKSPDIPSVLIETAYISNPDEEEKLGNLRYQQTIALSLMKGIRNYFIHSPPIGTVLAKSQF